MIKSVIAGAVAMAVVSFGVNAALTTPQGQGRVTLTELLLMLHAAFLRNQLISLLILDSFQKASFKQEAYPNQ